MDYLLSVVQWYPKDSSFSVSLDSLPKSVRSVRSVRESRANRRQNSRKATL